MMMIVFRVERRGKEKRKNRFSSFSQKGEVYPPAIGNIELFFFLSPVALDLFN
jgi:hypothetical protein